MRKILRPGNSQGTAVKLVATSVAVLLVASACGGTSETATDDASVDSAEQATADSTAAAPAESSTAESSTAESEEGGEGSADEADAPAENLFPDVEVTNVVDRSTVNLSTLVGGELPVLLWFWAPH